MLVENRENFTLEQLLDLRLKLEKELDLMNIECEELWNSKNRDYEKEISLSRYIFKLGVQLLDINHEIGEKKNGVKEINASRK